MSSGKVVLALLAGVATGAVLGILFAPEKGSETRKKLSGEGNDLKESMKEKFNAFLDDISEKYENVKEEVSDLTDKVKTTKDEADKKAKTAQGWWTSRGKIITDDVIAEGMEDNGKIIEELLGKVVAYGKTEIQLAKLKALDKTSDAVSTVVPHLIVITLALIFMLFVNLGIAFWLGGILGNIYYGFFAVAAFYGITTLVLRLFMHKWLKRQVGNYIIRNVLK